MARPKKVIDENLVEKLASVGCSNESIAIQVGCSVDTLHNRFSELLKKSREGLKTKLRIWQLESARKGSVAMQIWLGKQMLGQTDAPIPEDSVMKFVPLPSMVKDDII